MFDPHALARERYRSIPRIAVDLALWVAVAGLAAPAPLPIRALAAVFIGVVPMHDLMFHGHEGAHGHIARNRRVNELFTWLVHALFGLSGVGYRAFHLRHHRFTHTEKDPEYLLMDRVRRGAPGIAWLALPLASFWALNVAPLADPRLRGRVARDLAGALGLHAVLAALIGVHGWLSWVAAPAALVLGPVVVVRAVCEHHGLPAGETRSMYAGWLVGLIWSNANYHAEHHAFPAVPYHRLPALREAVAGCPSGTSYLATGLALLAEPNHWRPDGRL